MAVRLLLLLLLAMFSGSEAAFCVAKPGLNPMDPKIQTAIDYACGRGADCAATMQGGPCNGGGNKVLVFSYIANSYYQNNSPKGATCDFNGLATLSTTDPSAGSCKFASGPSAGAGTGMGTGGGMGGGAGTGAGTGGMGGAGTGGMGGAGAGTGTGAGTGAGAGFTTPGSSATTGTGGALSPPFGGGAYGPSGSSPDYSAAGRHAVTAAAAVVLAAAAHLLLH
ncbi:hypothetical protein ACP4OV_031595 [Aristida adscensionis]